MNTQEVIDYFRSNSLAHDTHPECVSGALDREVLAKLEKVKAFEEREPLVQELVLIASNAMEHVEGLCDPEHENYAFHHQASEAIRAVSDFVLQPSLDPAEKTGNKPGTDSDHTQEPADKSDTCHLSSVVEQRFRKPIDSQELPQASEQPPGNARVPSPERVEWALEHAQNSWVADSEEQNCKDVLAAEVRRLRALFGGFQLECCDDWSCAQDHARRAGEEIAGLRLENAKLLEDNAEIRAYNSRLAEQCAESLRELDRLRDESAIPLVRGDRVRFADGYLLDRVIYDRTRAKLERIEALIEMQHDDSTVRVSRIRAALRGES